MTAATAQPNTHSLDVRTTTDASQLRLQATIRGLIVTTALTKVHQAYCSCLSFQLYMRTWRLQQLPVVSAIGSSRGLECTSS